MNSLKNLIETIWDDPVGSNILALVITTIFVKLYANTKPVFLNLFNYLKPNKNIVNPLLQKSSTFEFYTTNNIGTFVISDYFSAEDKTYKADVSTMA